MSHQGVRLPAVSSGPWAPAYRTRLQSEKRSSRRNSKLDSPIEERRRCAWVTDELLRVYHDEEWGTRPQTDAEWFEAIILETFQAGLSWKTILTKREAFRAAFARFDPSRVAEFTPIDVERLMHDAGIVRNRKKIEATLTNARIAVAKVREFGSLQAFFTGLEQDDRDVLVELQSTFRAVGQTTAQSIADATGLRKLPHDAVCWMHGS